MTPHRFQIQAESGRDAVTAFDDFVRARLGEVVSVEVLATVRLVGEELMTNIVRHGYGNDGGPIEAVMEAGEQGVTLTLWDRALPFDPLTWRVDDEPSGEGKRGLLLVRRLTDRFSWRRTEEGWNEVSCRIPTAPPGASDAGDPLAHPRLRAEVVRRRLPGGAVLVGGPGIDRFVVDEGTATVLEACDGRTLPEVTGDLNRRHGWELTPEEVQGVIEPFGRFGYFEGTTYRSRRLLHGDPLWLLRMLKPLARLYGRTWVAVGTLLLAAGGYALTLWYGPTLLDAYGDLARFHPVGGPIVAIIGYYLGYSILALAHELGHALAVHRLGGAVPEIGIRSNFNFFVLCDRSVLRTTSDRVWYYAGGLLSDVVWWVVAWVWWLAAPSPIPLLLVTPQTVYFLVYAWAPSGQSDAALVLRELLGWCPLPRIGRASSGLSGWREAPWPQRGLEVARLSIALGLLVFVASRDLLILLLYLVYRLVRKILGRSVT